MANTFPTTLNDWDSGEVIESAWADALEAKIGVDNSTVATSLDYLIKNTSSKLGKIASLAVTDGNIIVGNGTNWVAESGATARTSLGLGTGDSPTFTKLGLGITNFPDTYDNSLHVVVQGEPNYIYLDNYYTGTDCTDLWFRHARGTKASPTATGDADPIGNLNYFGHTGVAWMQVASIQANMDGGIGSANMPGRLQFYTLPTAYTNVFAFERMRIDSNGNVGIGTGTSEVAGKLVVAQITSGEGWVSTTAAGTTVTGLNTQFTNTFKVGDTITVNAETRTISSIASDTSMETDAWTGNNTNQLYTLVGGTRFTVLGNGMIGIGKTPTTLLDVNGTGTFTLLKTGTGGIGIRDTSAAYDVTIAATSSTALTAGRTLTIDLVNAARTLKISGNATVDQDVSTGGSPSFTSRWMYVDRGDPSAHDFTSFTTNGTAQDLDLSSIVPAGAKAVVLRVGVTDDAAGSVMQFRKNGNSNWYNGLTVTTFVSGVTSEGVVIVACDVNRVIEYYATNTTFTSIIVTVCGWYI